LILKNLLLLLLLCWGYIMIFIKVLTIFHSWIHPLLNFLYSPFPHSWNSLNKSHFSTCIHVYTVFHHINSSIPSPTSSPSHWYQPPDRIYSTLLFSDFVKKNKWRYFCVFKIAIHWFPGDISIYIYMHNLW
jgi:hypothetical protein